jgi:hypothetical protein
MSVLQFPLAILADVGCQVLLETVAADVNVGLFAFEFEASLEVMPEPIEVPRLDTSGEHSDKSQQVHAEWVRLHNVPD